MAGYLILTGGIFQPGVSVTLALIRHGDSDEIKDFDILSLTVASDTYFLSNRFLMPKHIILTKVVLLVGGCGDLAGN